MTHSERGVDLWKLSNHKTAFRKRGKMIEVIIAFSCWGAS